MKLYTCTASPEYTGGGMDEDQYGEWCKEEDVRELKRIAIDALRAIVEQKYYHGDYGSAADYCRDVAQTALRNIELLSRDRSEGDRAAP